MSEINYNEESIREAAARLVNGLGPDAARLFADQQLSRLAKDVRDGLEDEAELEAWRRIVTVLPSD